jgi:predicted RNA-binding protein with PIN domain
MPFLIDGHNLIPNIPGMSLENPNDEQQLIDLLQSYCRVRRQRVEVFFDRAPDGQARSRQVGFVKVYYVSSRSSADEAIRRRLARIGREAPNWKVVTSDRQVQAEARAYGAEVIPSKSFADLLLDQNIDGNRQKSDQELSQAELDEWLRLFGDKKNK